MKLDLITAAEANTLIAGKHYLGPVRFPPRYCIATPDRTCVAIFSWPMAASFKVKFTSLELARLWRSDNSPHRTDHFLNRAVRKLKEYLCTSTAFSPMRTQAKVRRVTAMSAGASRN